MNMPSFTAEATLYKTSGQYRTARNAINPVAQAGHTIGLALGISDESIEVHSCRPGFIQIGEGPTMVCVDPGDPFGTRGHEGGSGPTGGDGVPTGGGGGIDPLEPNTCTTEQLKSPEAAPCGRQLEKDIKAGLEFNHYVRCSKDKKGNPIMACCQNYRDKQGTVHRRCTPISSKT